MNRHRTASIRESAARTITTESSRLRSLGRESATAGIDLGAQNFGWESVRSGTSTAIGCWIFRSQPAFATRLFKRVAPNPTTFFPTAAGSAYIYAAGRTLNGPSSFASFRMNSPSGRQRSVRPAIGMLPTSRQVTISVQPRFTPPSDPSQRRGTISCVRRAGSTSTECLRPGSNFGANSRLVGPMQLPCSFRPWKAGLPAKRPLNAPRPKRIAAPLGSTPEGPHPRMERGATSRARRT